MPLIRPPSSRAAGALVAALAGALTVVPGRAGAQGPDVPPPPPPQRNSIATNFIGIPFGFFSLDYERALTAPGLTAGLGGSHVTGDAFDDEGGSDRNSWVEAKVMFYPGERAFRGFSVGLTGGVHSARGIACDPEAFFDACSGAPAPRRTQTGATLGVLANYDWLLGRQSRFRVGLGFGAKRVLRDVEQGRDVLEQVYPDGRFVIGYTF